MMRKDGKMPPRSAGFVLASDPQLWPEVDTWPEASTDDLVQAALSQSTIDADYEGE